MTKQTQSRCFEFQSNISTVVIILETVALFIVGFVPYTNPNMIVTGAISLVAAIQFSVFRKLIGSTYNIIRSLEIYGQLPRKLILLSQKKDYKSAFQAVRFSMVNLLFLVGAILGRGLTLFIGLKAVWVTVVVLICSVFLPR